MPCIMTFPKLLPYYLDFWPWWLGIDVNSMQKQFRHTNFFQYTRIGPSHCPLDAKYAPPAHLKAAILFLSALFSFN